ncbi:hypothetical protein [uncultured Paraglaciecola sp.]|uniref:hypothetical protein n=1 Tax=uncultured Paraglaciecola sp. TaxID=1765024 RepID=UPI00260E4414|nr:hypothetical protein [uncultured Paraglaciecola sp.]
MPNSPKKTTFSLTKYLSKVELVAWTLCIFSMLTIIFAKQIFPAALPFAWLGAILGAGMIGWGMARKHKGH